MDRWQAIQSAAKTCAGLASVTWLAGCASAPPINAQQISDVESARRSASELGAQSNPQAKLYLKLATEQLAAAKTAAADDDSATASRLLERAKVDAELAIALTRGGSAQVDAKKAVEAEGVVRANDLPTTGATP